MREIEVKARVLNKAKLLEVLAEKQLKLTDPVTQHDVVYYIEGTKDQAPDSVWLRLRTENGTKTIFTLKKQHRGGLDSIEHETVVSNANEAESIVKELGFTVYSDLTKTRQKANIGEIEICIDEVEGLGSFIEAEKLSELDADGEKVENELWSLLVSFGIDKANEVLDGYDVLHRALVQE